MEIMKIFQKNKIILLLLHLIKMYLYVTLFKLKRREEKKILKKIMKMIKRAIINKMNTNKNNNLIIYNNL